MAANHNGLRHSVRILAGLCVATLVAAALWLGPDMVGVKPYEDLARTLPQSLRLRYLDHVFHNPTEDCSGCYFQLIGTLQALQDDPEAGAGFDYARLFPLLRNGPGYIREPVPQLACNLILRRRDPQLYRAMAAEFRGDEDSLKACVVFQLGGFKQFNPAEYEAISNALRNIPELSKYAPSPWASK